jgi:hypothetical protein
MADTLTQGPVYKAHWLLNADLPPDSTFQELEMWFRVNSVFIWAIVWLRRLVAGLSPQRPSFHAGSVHVGLEQVQLRVLRFPSVMLNIRRHLRNTPTRTNGRNLETFQQVMLFWKSGSIGQKSTWYLRSSAMLRSVYSWSVTDVSGNLSFPSSRVKQSKKKENTFNCFCFQRANQIRWQFLLQRAT